jgi:hypothetical protein
MFFNASQAGEAYGAVVPPKQGGGSEPSQHLNQQQFGKKAGPAEGAEGGAAEGAAGAEGAAAGAGELAELAPLLLL